MPDINTVVVTPTVSVVAVNSSVPGSYDAVGRLGLGMYSVREYGTVGDGVTNDTTAITAAYTACPAGGTLYFPGPATYLFDPITFTKVVHLELHPGATLKANSVSSNKGLITYAGSVSATTTTLAGTVAPGAMTANLTSASAFAANDICLIEDTSQASTEYAYEFVRLLAKSSNDVYFVSATELPFTYPASSNGTFTKITALEGIRVRGGTWDGNSLGGTNVSLLRFEYCFDVDVDDVWVTNFDYVGIQCAYSKYIRLRRPRITNSSADLAAASPPDAGYGILLNLSSSHLLVTDALAWRCRHAIQIGEGAHTVRVSGGDYSGCYLGAVETHFRRARFVEFDGCTVSGTAYRTASTLTLPSNGAGVTSGSTSGSAGFDTLVLMRGIKVQRTPGVAIQFVQNTLTNTYVVIDGAIIDGCAPATGQSSGDISLFKLRYASISNVMIQRGDTVNHAGFRIQNCEDITLNNCQVVFTASQTNNQGFYVIDSKRVTLDTCTVQMDGTGQAFRVDSTASGDSNDIQFIGCRSNGTCTAKLYSANATLIRELSPGWRTTAHVAGDYAASSGWGTSPTITPVATDQGGRVSVLAQATTGANPTLTLTFKGGTFGGVPSISYGRGDSSAPTTCFWALTSVSATTAVWTLVGTPTAGNTYVLDYTIKTS